MLVFLLLFSNCRSTKWPEFTSDRHLFAPKIENESREQNKRLSSWVTIGYKCRATSSCRRPSHPRRVCWMDPDRIIAFWIVQFRWVHILFLAFKKDFGGVDRLNEIYTKYLRKLTTKLRQNYDKITRKLRQNYDGITNLRKNYWNIHKSVQVVSILSIMFE